MFGRIRGCCCIYNLYFKANTLPCSKHQCQGELGRWNQRHKSSLSAWSPANSGQRSFKESLKPVKLGKLDHDGEYVPNQSMTCPSRCTLSLTRQLLYHTFIITSMRIMLSRSNSFHPYMQILISEFRQLRQLVDICNQIISTKNVLSLHLLEYSTVFLLVTQLLLVSPKA